MPRADDSLPCPLPEHPFAGHRFPKTRLFQPKVGAFGSSRSFASGFFYLGVWRGLGGKPGSQTPARSCGTAAASAPRASHKPPLSLQPFQIAAFKCLTSQSRHSLNCDGFGSPGSSISTGGCFTAPRSAWSSRVVGSPGRGHTMDTPGGSQAKSYPQIPALGSF